MQGVESSRTRALFLDRSIPLRWLFPSIEDRRLHRQSIFRNRESFPPVICRLEAFPDRRISALKAKCFLPSSTAQLQGRGRRPTAILLWNRAPGYHQVPLNPKNDIDNNAQSKRGESCFQRIQFFRHRPFEPAP